MAQASNKRLKYEFKLKNAEAERHNADAERRARLQELQLQIQLTQLANPIACVAQVPSVLTNIYSNPILTPVQPHPPLIAYNIQSPLLSSTTTANSSGFSFSSPSFGSFGGETEGTSMSEGSSNDEWLKSGDDVFTNENNFNDIYGSQ
jgi:hypothetical protein